MINIETRKAYSEVNIIIELLGNAYSSKIPNEIKEVFKKEMDKEYVPSIDINKPVKEQNLRRKTIAIISALNLQYWCENDAKKKELQMIYKENGVKHQEELRKKYNPDNIFKKADGIIENNIARQENVQLIEYKKQNIFSKIFSKIMKILKNN